MTRKRENWRLPKIIVEGTAMKLVTHFLHVPVVMLALGLTGGGTASAQVSASDSAAAYTNGWLTGTNLGSGFLPWILTNNGASAGGFAGNFIGNSGTLIDT